MPLRRRSKQVVAKCSLNGPIPHKILSKSDYTKLCKQVKAEVEQPGMDTALRFITTYQWDDSTGPLTAQKVEQYTKNIQKSLGLKATGVIDYKLVKMMEHTPRCGMPDYEMNTGPEAAKWGLTNLTYFVEQYVEGLSKADQDVVLANAFNSWARVANLSFTRVTTPGKANFVISTGRGRANNFDGPSNTLAWAYLPSGNSYQGQLLMRFDLDERWVVDPSQRGILMENVACHEFGHLLGLDHSRISSALMAPYYSPNVSKPIDNDDVKRIVALYGKPQQPPVTPPVAPTTPPAAKHTITIKVSSLDDVLVNGKSLTSPSTGKPTDFNLITP